MIPAGFLRGEHNNEEEETRIQQTKISLINNNYLRRLHHCTRKLSYNAVKRKELKISSEFEKFLSMMHS